MADTTNIKLGACSVTFGGTDLGHTKGGVTINYAPEYADITADQYGNTLVDKALMGELLTVTIPLSESQIANLANAMPMGTLAGGGNGRLTLGKDAGDRLLAQAGQLVLHPLFNSTGDATNDIVIHKAVVHSEVEVNYQVDEQTVVEVEFVALIDTSKSDGNYLGHFGDSTD